jgi:hypothetical protein
MECLSEILHQHLDDSGAARFEASANRDYSGEASEQGSESGLDSCQSVHRSIGVATDAE